uniref:Uncharacterized protein n=1 Tax=Panagrellus redivivus TaxID=6233 RepID=A0A7E4W7Q1_PANRE
MWGSLGWRGEGNDAHANRTGTPFTSRGRRPPSLGRMDGRGGVGTNAPRSSSPSRTRGLAKEREKNRKVSSGEKEEDNDGRDEP